MNILSTIIGCTTLVYSFLNNQCKTQKMKISSNLTFFQESTNIWTNWPCFQFHVPKIEDFYEIMKGNNYHVLLLVFNTNKKLHHAKFLWFTIKTKAKSDLWGCPQLYGALKERKKQSGSSQNSKKGKKKKKHLFHIMQTAWAQLRSE